MENERSYKPHLFDFFGPLVRLGRIHKGLSARQLCKLAGVPGRSLYLLEKETGSCRPATGGKIAQALWPEGLPWAGDWEDYIDLALENIFRRYPRLAEKFSAEDLTFESPDGLAWREFLDAAMNLRKTRRDSEVEYDVLACRLLRMDRDPLKRHKVEDGGATLRELNKFYHSDMNYYPADLLRPFPQTFPAMGAYEPINAEAYVLRSVLRLWSLGIDGQLPFPEVGPYPEGWASALDHIEANGSPVRREWMESEGQYADQL